MRADRQALRDNPARTGIFLDYDGVLSHIVEKPSDARPIEGVAGVLAQLNHSYAAAVVVSGRSAHELLEWLGPEVEIWGLHGAEHTKEGRVVLSDQAQPFLDTMREVLTEMRSSVDELGLEGVIVEDKGVMVGLHYRTASDRGRAEAELARLARAAAERHDLIVATSKMAFELRPPAEFSKFQVVKQRASELDLEVAAFAGDDVVDIPGFEALDELEGDGVSTLRLAVTSDEAPEELLARADETVEGPEGMLEWLRALL